MEALEEEIQTNERFLSSRATHRARIPQAPFQEDLAMKYSELYRYGKTEALDRAIEHAQEAVKYTREHEGEEVLDRRRSVLVDCLINRGRRADLQEATGICNQMIEIQNVGTIRGNWLAMLAACLLRQFHWTGDMNNLEQAIASARRAVDLAEGSDSCGAHMLLVARGLSERFKRKKEVRDAEEAIDIIRQITALGESDGNDNPSKADAMLHLANILSQLYLHTRKENVLDEALAAARACLDSTPKDYPPELALSLYILASNLALRFKLKANIEDLSEAIKHATTAVEMTPKGHPDIPTMVRTLANCLLDRFYHTGDKSDKEQAMKKWLQIFGSENLLTIDRLEAAREAIKLQVTSGEFAAALTVAEQALNLLPTVCSRYLDQADQQYAVGQTSGLAADTCSLQLVANGNPNRALEVLEHGRGLIIGYMIDGRGDISDLRRQFPREADEYGKLRSQVLTTVKGNDSVSTGLGHLQDRQDYEADLEGCLKNIRELRDSNGQQPFRRFLLPPLADELMSCADQGPIVLVNVTSISSDALIVRPSGVEPIHLANFKAPEVQRFRPWGLTRSMRDAEQVEDRQQDKRYRRFLRQLWMHCVRPVLEKLDFLNPTDQSHLPRVWWIGTGLASSLPFHAAGIHSADSDENTFKYVISSYTPSIRALRYARERAIKMSTSQSLLLVTMLTTPGMHDLPAVEKEKEKITSAIKKPHSVRLLPQPHAEAVLNGLRRHNIVHFACHGSSDSADPSNSYLALEGEFYSVDRLTVRKISGSRLRRSWLAYLSACSTAQNKVTELADEALHLAAGFQVAGFAHTIASMWPSNDDICAQIAGIFYDELLTKGGIQEGNCAAAKALHTAVKQIRSQHIQQPSLWAQYIHMGA
ncbi:CHAT domain-containing protein [Aspergillus navahoensis]